MLNLETPRKFRPLVNQARKVDESVLRPISRKYDRAEHACPLELDMLAAIVDGMNEGTSGEGAGAGKFKQDKKTGEGIINGTNMSTVLGLQELCWGDVGLSLTLPRQGLGNAAIAAVADRKSTRLNSSHVRISYAVFCL